MNSAKENRGCDRHLLGLMLISKELGLDMPKIFKDTAWKKRYALEVVERTFLKVSINPMV